MENKPLIKLLIIFIALALLGFFVGSFFTGQAIREQKILGYCPTIQSEAMVLAEENNYIPKELSSAAVVLQQLKSGQIDSALIGRKAYSYEISNEISEKVLKSGFTLVSNQKSFISISQLNSSEIYVPEGFNGFEFRRKIEYGSEESRDLINQGKIVLISWDDWQDNFELVVVMNGSEKVREFRGVFLYSY